MEDRPRIGGAERQAILAEELAAWPGREVELMGDCWARLRLMHPDGWDRSTSFISWGEVRADLPYLISVDHHGDIRAREVRWPTRDLSVVTCRETGVSIALNASRDVRSFIRAGGGRVFLWLEPPGAPLVGSRASLRPPNVPVFFDEFDASDFTLHVEHGFEPPQGFVSTSGGFRGAALSSLPGSKRTAESPPSTSSAVIVYAVVHDAPSPDFPLGVELRLLDTQVAHEPAGGSEARGGDDRQRRCARDDGSRRSR